MKLVPVILACALVRSSLALHDRGTSRNSFASFAKSTGKGAPSDYLDHAHSDDSGSSSGLKASLLNNLHRIDGLVEKSLSDRSKKLRRRRPPDHFDEDSCALDLDENLPLKTIPAQIFWILNSTIGRYIFQAWLWLTRSLFGDPYDAVTIQLRKKLRFLRSEWNPTPLPPKTPLGGRSLTSRLPQFSASAKPVQSNMHEMLGFDNTATPRPDQDVQEPEEAASEYDFSESRQSSPLGLLIDRGRRT